MGKATSSLASRLSGMTAPSVLDGAMDGEVFNAWSGFRSNLVGNRSRFTSVSSASAYYAADNNAYYTMEEACDLSA